MDGNGADGPSAAAQPCAPLDEQVSRGERLMAALRSLWTGEEVKEPETRWAVENRTPWPIWVDGEAGGAFALGPLEQRLEQCDPLQRLPRLQRLVERRQLVVEERDAEQEATGALAGALRFGVVAVVLWGSVYLLMPSRPWLLVGGGLAVALFLVLFVRLTRPGRVHEARRVRRWTWQSLTMAAVVGIAVAAPALALWFGTELHADVILGGPTLVRTDEPLELIVRLLQLTLIAVASMLPALMFFQFDAERLSTLRDRWMQVIFRIDPSVATVSDVEAKYGKQIEEAYGPKGDGRGRLTRGRRSPLIVATVVVTFGWLLILLGAGPSEPLADGEQLRFTDLLTPEPGVITFAFLGAYFFGLNLVHHAYVRGDLRPKTYNAITTRILLVVIIAWLLQAGIEVYVDNGVAYGTAFLAGLVPRTVLHGIVERLPVRSDDGGEVAGADQLRSLDGIDLYERTRLSDEGIRTLQALAHHDVVDLFFKTRIAPARLIDWLDQAVLQLYLTDATGAGEVTRRGVMTAMRALGVRTATDFLAAVSDTGSRGVLAHRLTAADCRWPEAEVHGRLDLLRQAIETSEWVARVRYWRCCSFTAVRLENRRWIDATGELQPGDPRLSGIESQMAVAATTGAPAAPQPAAATTPGAPAGPAQQPSRPVWLRRLLASNGHPVDTRFLTTPTATANGGVGSRR